MVGLSVLFLTLSGCKSNDQDKSFTEKVEKAHNKDTFTTKEAIQFDLNLEFGGTERVNATFTLLTNSTKGVIDFRNSSKIVVDKVYFSPTITNEECDSIFELSSS